MTACVLLSLRVSLMSMGGLDGPEPQAQSLRDRGVEAVTSDSLEPEILDPALEGASTVLLLTPIHPERVTRAGNVIKAAKESGNDPRVVRLSVHQASREAPTRNRVGSMPSSKTS